MFNSPFDPQDEQTPGIPEDCDVVFVADLFARDYAGGAELTSKAIIEWSRQIPLKVHELHSRDVTVDLLQQGHEKHWIFGNFSGMNLELLPTIVANMSYSILEYDYKFCRYRSIEKHENETGSECDCHQDIHGKLVSSFFYAAKSIWWMSEEQAERYYQRFEFLREKDSVVLSSVFDDGFFAAVKLLKKTHKDTERKGWIVLGSDSWIKGKNDAIKWCEDNGHDYEVLWNLPYAQVLEKLATAEGFVYLPKGGDTCPRMVIEAKMLGCKLHLNEHVQHAKEIWFDTEDPFDTEAYLYAARERFWNGIMSVMNHVPSISGYTTTLDCNKHGYPWKESIASMLGFCQEVVVVDGGSSDETWEELQAWGLKEPRLKAVQIERDWNHKRFAVFDGAQKAAARSRCTGTFCWQQDADEIVPAEDYSKVIKLARSFPKQIDLISLPVVEFWGSHSKVRADIFPWKWRLSRNLPHITHGIPDYARRYDENNDLYAHMGTDGCDYVHAETYETIPHASFYTPEVDQVRVTALEGNDKALDSYQEWFQRNIDLLPSVYHYSWFNLERKIKTYRDYWSKHWQSLYDIEQEDTAENNMFFQRPWSEVTDKDIVKLAAKLEGELGGWIFHSPVDFSKPTPHLNLNLTQPPPESMKQDE